MGEKLRAALAAFWVWLTTSRYVRRIEQDNEELKAVNRDLLNSILTAQGMQPVGQRASTGPAMVKRATVPSLARGEREAFERVKENRE